MLGITPKPESVFLALRENNGWRYIRHVGTGFNHEALEELHGKFVKLKTPRSPFPARVKDEAVTTWVKPALVAEVKFTEWTSSGEMRHPVYLGLRADKRACSRARKADRLTVARAMYYRSARNRKLAETGPLKGF